MTCRKIVAILRYARNSYTESNCNAYNVHNYSSLLLHQCKLAEMKAKFVFEVQMGTYWIYDIIFNISVAASLSQSSFPRVKGKQ